MILIYTSTLTPRINYTFRQVCGNILGLEIKFTSKIEEFIAHEGPKLSYGKQKLGNELFIQQAELLLEQGFTDIDVRVSKWEDTVCFFRVSEQSGLPFDIFAASFFMLSRYEEYLPHVKDEFGRYPFKESTAFKEDFITQPVVDIWAHKFKKVLLERFPQMSFDLKGFRNRNILAVSQAYKYRKKGIVRAIGSSVRDFFSLQIKELIERFRVLTFLKKDPYDVYNELVTFSKKENIPWCFMFQLSNYSIHDKNIGYNKMKYHALIKSMGDYGEIGLLAGYEALFRFKVLRIEKKRWEGIVNRPLKFLLSNMYDVNLPELYNSFDTLEFERDFSMGFVDAIGFRAGTCTPYLFYDINFERISPLILETPVFNSKVLKNMSYFEVKTTLEKIKTDVQQVGGKLVLIFENSDFADERDCKKYLDLINKLNDNE